ncbi:amidase [Mycolicibacterium sp. 120266]|uniref:amidase n=1 Tax=Mycolicibacterium sp. 120266 TaxID=3090601 RepID=UPI00299D5E99|nr:amidase [Mycolicibacterium sp. 120266]MDX1872948.1 amidase [Mycolicibacterium sp. 120266]
MPVDRPDDDAIALAAAHFGLHLDAADRKEFAELIDGALASYDVVDELHGTGSADCADRGYQFPEAYENPLGAWYVTTRINSGTTTSAGPLVARSLAVKDNIAVAGVPMMNGSRSLEGFTPSRDATVVSRLLDAGVVVAGKAVCEDLCFSGSSFTSATGPVRNPWRHDREAGGSSSGSAALVANGDVDLALGGDQGGSVRIPAAFCGVVGHKPTFGLVPYTGAFPIERTLDHVGPITRTVVDAAHMLSVIAGRDGADPRQPDTLTVDDYVSGLGAGVAGLRIGVLSEGFGHAASQVEVDDIVRAAATQFADLGATVESVSIPWHLNAFHVWNVIATDGGAYQMLDGSGYGLNASGLYDPEQMAYFAQHRVTHADELSESVKLVALCGHHGVTALGGSSYGKARNLVPKAMAAYDTALEHFDVLVMPTVPYVATALPETGVDRPTYLAKALGMLANTAPFNVTGHPALSIPAGQHDGLPVGMMIVGRHFDDATVLRAGHAFEMLRGGFPAPHAVNASDAILPA